MNEATVRQGGGFRRAVLCVCALLLAVPVVFAPTPASSGPEDSWETLTPMDKPRQEFGAATGSDGRIYAVGGNGVTAEVYDPATADWEPLPQMNVQRSETAAVTAGCPGDVDRECVYAISGIRVDARSTAEVYDPSTGKWEFIAPLTAPHQGLAAVAARGRIYAIGGGSFPSSASTVEVYDPTNPSVGWVRVDSMNRPRSNFGAAVGSDGRIYAVGGSGTSAEAYDIDGNEWTLIEPAPTSRSYLTAAAGPDGRIYAIGGYKSSERTEVPLVEVYDPGEKRWARVADMPTARRYLAATLMSDGRIVALGGYDVNRDTIAAAEAYTSGPMPPPPPPPEEEEPPTGPVDYGPFTEYVTSSRPASITGGPDRDLWFTLPSDRSIGRMTPDGQISSYTVGARPEDITLGPDGNLWFTEPADNRIGKITPHGDVTHFELPITFHLKKPWEGGLRSITGGPDGNVWFTHTSTNQIGRITPDGDAVGFRIPTNDSEPSGITSGPDGNVWFTEAKANKIGRITPDGQIDEYAAGAQSGSLFGTGDGTRGITAGPDGNLWFTVTGGSSRTRPAFGRISPDVANPGASIRHFPLDGGAPGAITVGPDGNLWVADRLEESWNPSHRLLRIDPVTATVTVYPLRTYTEDGDVEVTPELGDIAGDPAGEPYVWYTQTSPNAIGRLDVRAEAQYSYVPLGAEVTECVSLGDPQANYRQTETKSCTIATEGPLAYVIVNPYSVCQVFHLLDDKGEHFSYARAPSEGYWTEDTKGDGECATLVSVDTEEDEPTLYGPWTVPCYYDILETNYCDFTGPPTEPADRPYRFVKQEGVFGTGLWSDPYRIITVYEAGDVRITQTDSYIVGTESYRTDVKLTNTGSGSADVLLTRAGDCYLQGDSGQGRYDPETEAVACMPNLAGTRIMEWQPISPGSRWFEGERQYMWALVGDHREFPNKCVQFGDWPITEDTPSTCARPYEIWPLDTENGAGLTWKFSLAAGETTVRSHWTTFSFLGHGATPRASISDVQVKEPPQGEAEAVFEVSLDFSPKQPVTLDYTTVDGTATDENGLLGPAADPDYEARSGSVTFEPDGPLTQTVTVPVLADEVSPEPAEEFYVDLSDRLTNHVPDGSGADGYDPIGDGTPRTPGGRTVIIEKSRGIGTIGDLPPQALSVGVVTVGESRAGPVPAEFTVTLSDPAPRPVSFDFETSDGSATAGEDYEARSGRLEIPAGETSASITVDVLADDLAEDDETFTVTLSNADGARIDRPRGTGTILDAREGLSIGDATVTEGNSGTTPARFTVTLAETYPETVTVKADFATVDGTAEAGTDYETSAGTVEFAPDESFQVIEIGVLTDTIPEETERFTVVLSDPTGGAPLARETGMGTILDDDEPPGPDPPPDPVDPPPGGPTSGSQQPPATVPSGQAQPAPGQAPGSAQAPAAGQAPASGAQGQGQAQGQAQAQAQAQAQSQAQGQSQAQAQQQAQSQAQAQVQQQAQAQGQAAVQGHPQAQGQAQPHAGVMADRERGSEAEHAYISAKDQPFLASARQPASPLPAAVAVSLAGLFAAAAAWRLRPAPADPARIPIRHGSGVRPDARRPRHDRRGRNP